ncbi:MAG: hypothetical protein EBZ77_16160, partial [Chitinophagia bacterium]|nr:hypothetical protein [Chitinophagia bacterium]
MNKNFIFLALILSITTNDLFTAAGKRKRDDSQEHAAAEAERKAEITRQNLARAARFARRAARMSPAIAADAESGAAAATSEAATAATPMEEDAQAMCPICLGSDSPTRLLIAPEAQAMLTCTHSDFHQKCLEKWLATPTRNYCPFCRAPS